MATLDDKGSAYSTPPGRDDSQSTPTGNNNNNSGGGAGGGGGGGGGLGGSPASYVPTANGRKRKAEGTSSRGVANLTPEQLAKKRANDREAQRAIRERTKNQIETLERRIKELESQQPFQELQNVLRAKNAIMAENEDLKRRMQSMWAFMQPIVAPQTPVQGQVPMHPQSEAPMQSQAYGHAHVQAQGHVQAGQGPPQHPGQGQGQGQGQGPVPGPAQNQAQGLNGQSQPSSQRASTLAFLAHSADLAAVTSQQSPIPMPVPVPVHMAPPPPQAHMYPAQGQAQGQAQQQHAGSYLESFPQHHLHPDLRNSDAASAGASASPGAQMHSMHSSASPANGQRPQGAHNPAQFQVQQSAYYPSEQHYPVNDDMRLKTSPARLEARRRDLMVVDNGKPLHLRLPRTTDPTCPLDSLLLDFQAERHQAAAMGTPSSSLVGPAYPAISSLLNPSRAEKSHPLSKVFTDILSKFPSISGLPEQVAVLYVMFLVMRWHVDPSPENYQRLPEFARPVRSQLEVPHPAWVDHLPWPMMRDRIITAAAQNPAAYPFDSFFLPYTTTLSLNWPYEPKQCLLPNANRISSSSPTATSTPPKPAAAAAAASGKAGAKTAKDTPANVDAIGKALGATGADEDEFTINPVFESHLRNLGNWSLGSAFGATFPELVEDVRVKDD